MQSQSYVIKPNGSVRGGTASYDADTDLGRISYSVSVDVRIVWPVTKTVTRSGVYQVDPMALRSCRLQKPGDSMRIGNVTFTVLACVQGLATVGIIIDGSDYHGSGTIDTSAEFIRIRSLVAVGSVPVLGQLTVEADEVPGQKLGLIARCQFFLYRLMGGGGD